MSKFIVQMHTHTAETSRCGHGTAKEMIEAAKECGIDAVVITDHFFNANIRIDAEENLSWAQKVERQFLGYHLAKEVGDRIGVKVWQGWETFTKGPEYLTYGLGEAFLLKHPDIEKLPLRTYIDTVLEAGGYLIHAHPFRKASYIPDFTPSIYGLTAVEVYNAGNGEEEWNERALAFAKKYDLPMIGGSDAHRPENINTGLTVFDREIDDLFDLKKAIENGEARVVRQG